LLGPVEIKQPHARLVKMNSVRLWHREAVHATLNWIPDEPRKTLCGRSLDHDVTREWIGKVPAAAITCGSCRNTLEYWWQVSYG
jgi:hypothetical protein